MAPNTEHYASPNLDVPSSKLGGQRETDRKKKKDML